MKTLGILFIIIGLFIFCKSVKKPLIPAQGVNQIFYEERNGKIKIESGDPQDKGSNGGPIFGDGSTMGGPGGKVPVTIKLVRMNTPFGERDVPQIESFGEVNEEKKWTMNTDVGEHYVVLTLPSGKRLKITDEGVVTEYQGKGIELKP